MKELKEVLNLVEERKEKAIEEYYDYIMECDRNGNEIDRFKLGTLHGTICGYKEDIKLIENIINGNTPKKDKAEDKTKEPSTKDLAEMLEVLAFLSFIESVLGIPSEPKVTVHKFSNAKDFEEFFKTLTEEK